MACHNNHASAFFLIALILFAAKNPIAHSTTGNILNVIGELCCTANGTCPGLGVPGVSVALKCTNPRVPIAIGTTKAGGNFTISTTIPSGSLTPSTLKCEVNIKLPVNSTMCSLFNAVEGSLIAPLGEISGMPLPGVSVNVTIGPFQLVQGL